MTLRLPLPPSVNAAYANVPGVGRIASRRLRAWKKTAGWQILIQKPQRVYDRYGLTITVPEKMRGDVSNRIKAVEDILVELRVTPDDSKCARVIVQRGNVTEMEIEIEPLHMRETA